MPSPSEESVRAEAIQQLDAHRAAIDANNESIFGLVLDNLHHGDGANAAKSQLDKGVLDVKRENEIDANIADLCAKHGIQEVALMKNVFAAIRTLSKSRQDTARVAEMRSRASSSALQQASDPLQTAVS